MDFNSTPTRWNNVQCCHYTEEEKLEKNKYGFLEKDPKNSNEIDIKLICICD